MKRLRCFFSNLFAGCAALVTWRSIVRPLRLRGPARASQQRPMQPPRCHQDLRVRTTRRDIQHQQVAKRRDGRIGRRQAQRCPSDQHKARSSASFDTPCRADIPQRSRFTTSTVDHRHRPRYYSSVLPVRRRQSHSTKRPSN